MRSTGIDAIAIPTRGLRPAEPGDAPRLDALLRCIGELSRRRDARWDRPEIVVFVDGDGAAVRGCVHGVCREVRVLDLHDRRRFAERLAAAAANEVHAEAVRYALFGEPTVRYRVGAVRNHACLALAGRRVLFVDDDVVPVAHRTPCAEAGEPCESMMPVDTWCFTDPQAVEAALDPVEYDLVEQHRAWLGRRVSRADGSRPRVAVTHAGLAGDAGMGSPYFALAQDGATRERLLATPESYATAKGTRQMIRGAVRPTIVASDFLMSTAISMDLCAPLPPFSPNGRNADNLLGMTMHVAVPEIVTMCLPFVVPHHPPERRSFSPAAFRFGESRLNDLLRCATFALSLEGKHRGEPSDLATLSALLRRQTDTGPAALGVWLQAQRRNMARATARKLIGLIERYGAHPLYWYEDVQQYLSSCDEAAAAHSVTAAEIAIRPEAAETTHRIVRQYADLLGAWPTLRALAIHRRPREHGPRA